jgi:hypothetical protein
MIAMRKCVALVLAAAWALSYGHSATAQTTAADIASAILGQGNRPLSEVDITADGIVDARDLACFHANCNPASVEFALGSSQIDEGAGTVQLQLTLSRSAFCTLHYSIDGPAVPGTDYVAPTGTITLAGTSASIPITILDDGNLDEELEPLIVSIGSGTCYRTGAQSTHTLHLLDNDRVWVGTLEAQMLGSNPPAGSGDLLGLRINVVRSNGTATVTLVSDGAGTLPPGSWLADAFNHGTSSFGMTIAPVMVVESTTSFAAALNRRFSFAASNGTPGQEVRPDVVRGSYVETITPVNSVAGHLSTTVVGRFSLLQSAPRPSTWVPPLDPSP